CTQEKRTSFAQPCGLTKGYFCPHAVHQTACSFSRVGPSRASRRLAPHRHLATGVEHVSQKRTPSASKHLRWTNIPLTRTQNVGPENTLLLYLWRNYSPSEFSRIAFSPIRVEACA